jgi:membrane-bound metal-dependent hydrolase YbcI (DUF457 family)
MENFNKWIWKIWSFLEYFLILSVKVLTLYNMDRHYPETHQTSCFSRKSSVSPRDLSASIEN